MAEKRNDEVMGYTHRGTQWEFIQSWPLLGLLTGNYPATGRLKVQHAGLDPDLFKVNAFAMDGTTRRDLPPVALQRYAEGDKAVPARYARAIALYRKGTLGSALLTIDGLIKEFPNDPYFHELRGQMLFENGRAAEAVPSYRRAVQLVSANIIKIDFARALLETNKPADDQEAVRNLEIARQTESDSFELWRLTAAAYSKLNNPGMTSLARAEMAIIRGNRAEAQAHAAAAERQLQSGTPAWQRAQDIKAYINSRPKKR